jgi:rare lipoprotein A
VTSGEKSVILKINDVGPLLPGRVIDLTERAMRWLDRGVLAAVTLTPLLEDGPAFSMAGDVLDDVVR